MVSAAAAAAEWGRLAWCETGGSMPRPQSARVSKRECLSVDRVWLPRKISLIHSPIPSRASCPPPPPAAGPCLSFVYLPIIRWAPSRALALPSTAAYRSLIPPPWRHSAVARVSINFPFYSGMDPASSISSCDLVHSVLSWRVWTLGPMQVPPDPKMAGFRRVLIARYRFEVANIATIATTMV